MRAIAQLYKLNKFLTLTLDPKKLDSVENVVRYLREIFSEFRVYLFRKFGKVKINYIAVLEFHAGGGPNDGVPHLHILLDTYIEQAWISKTWGAIGGGERVWIKAVSVVNASRYLSKYLTKDLMLSAPKKTRRITTSRSIKLNPKVLGPKHYSWALKKCSIQFCYSFLSSAFSQGQGELFEIVESEFDEEDFLKAFAIPQSL